MYGICTRTSIYHKKSTSHVGIHISYMDGIWVFRKNTGRVFASVKIPGEWPWFFLWFWWFRFFCFLIFAIFQYLGPNTIPETFADFHIMACARKLVEKGKPWKTHVCVFFFCSARFFLGEKVMLFWVNWVETRNLKLKNPTSHYLMWKKGHYTLGYW